MTPERFEEKLWDGIAVLVCGIGFLAVAYILYSITLELIK